MSIRDDFFAAKAKGSLWDVAVSIKRGNPLPLDADSIFESYAALEAYAADVLAYPGQVVAVVNADSTGIYYLDQNLAIKPVGVIPTGDGKSIEVTADGVISMMGVSTAESLTLPRMKADKSGIEWVPVSSVVQGDGNDNTTYEFALNEAGTGFVVTTKFNGVAVEGGVFEFNPSIYTKDEVDGLIDGVDAKFGDLGDKTVAEVIAAEAKRAGDAEKALDEAIKAIDFVDPDELADAIKDFATTSYVDGEIDKIEDAISKLNHFKAEVVDNVDDVTDVGILYLIKNEDAIGADVYDEYILVNGEPTLIGDTTTDLSNYYNKDDIDGKVEVLEGAIADEVEAREALAEEVEALKAIDNATQKELDDYKLEVTEALNGKANNATTLAGYGITDAYTKSEVYTKGEADQAIADKIAEVNGGESAGEVLGQLNAYKKIVNMEVWGNETAEGDSRIDAIEAKLNGVEADADVNLIEKIKLNGADVEIASDKSVNIVVTPTTLGVYTKGEVDNVTTGLSERITAAQNQADKGVDEAGKANAAAATNAEAIADHKSRIGVLETAKGDHLDRIVKLEAHDEAHKAEYNALNTTLGEHGTDIANLKVNKADASTLNAVSANVTVNANAIKAINETTLPAMNEEIGKKANAVDVYKKTEIGVIAEGKTLIDMINESVYNDADIKASIKANTDALAILNGDVETAGSVAKVAADAAKAEVAAVIDSAPEALNTLKEIADWISADETATEALITRVVANETAVGTTLPAAIAKCLEDANKYTDEKMVKADGLSIVNNDGTFSVNQVSTDTLVQGDLELVLCGGKA
jgi:hypothetical protein